jgi:hypothetical protein
MAAGMGAWAQGQSLEGTRVQEIVDAGRGVLLPLDGALAPLTPVSSATEEMAEPDGVAVSDPLFDQMEEPEVEALAGEPASSDVTFVDGVEQDGSGLELAEAATAVVEAEERAEPDTETAMEEVASVDLEPDADALPSSEMEIPLTATNVELGDPESIGPYRLWLASFRNESEAQADWDQLVQNHPDVLGSLVPILVLKDLGTEEGTFFRLQAGPLSSEAVANESCDQLQESRSYCTVLGP